MKTTKKRKRKWTKRTMLELAGQALIILILLGVIGLVVWHVFFTPQPPYAVPILTEGANKDYGVIQSVNVVLHDGTMVRCLEQQGSYGYSISCDWGNATEGAKPS